MTDNNIMESEKNKSNISLYHSTNCSSLIISGGMKCGVPTPIVSGVVLSNKESLANPKSAE
jgi:hypothetical protein